VAGAIFCERRPATIIRSAWRGDGRKTSAPNRATSKRAAAMDIISIAQQANPKPSGQIELLHAQFTALSSVVKMIPSSSRRSPKSSGLVSVTCLPRDTLIRSPSQVCSHRERFETNCLPASRCDISCLRVSSQVGVGRLDGAVVQLFVRRRSSVFCARAKPRERSEEHTSELQSRLHLVCRLLLEKKKYKNIYVRLTDFSTGGRSLSIRLTMARCIDTSPVTAIVLTTCASLSDSDMTTYSHQRSSA